MIDSLPVAIYTTDAEGRLTHHNPAAVEFSGRKPQLGTDQWCVTLKLYHPDGRPMPHDQCPMALALKEKRQIRGAEAIAERPDGKRIWFRAYPSPILDKKGNLTGGINMLVDISEEKRAEKQLQKSKKELDDFFDNATIGLHWVGPGGIIKKVNQRELDLLGYTRDEYVGHHISEFHTDKKIIEDILTRLKNRDELEDYETTLLCKDGSFKHVLINSNVYEEDGKFIHTRCFTRDITEQKQAQEKLKELNRTLEQRVEERTSTLKSYQEQLRSLASELSKAEERERHHLATELHDNLGQMLALGKIKIDMVQKEYFSNGESSDINSLQKLMDDALTYTRKLMLDLKPPPSLKGEDLRVSIRWITKQMEKHNLKVTVKDDERPKPVDDDVKITLLQCVRELLFNILKHTSEKKAVLSLARKENQLLITVTDEGEGFVPENQELIPGQQGGFGLFNIQERIDLLGGRVDIHSDLGEGTQVALYIPLKEKDQMSEAIGQSYEAGRIREIRQRKVGGERIKILLVDDHQMVREGLRKIIDDHKDIEVIAEAANGEEAVKLARETSPDVILMDVNMPVMDGIEATRKINTEMPDIRIIGLSLHDDEDVIADMRSAGASAYLTKSEAFESLIVTVQSEASAPKG